MLKRGVALLLLLCMALPCAVTAEQADARRVVYLTFDDGPKKDTPELLDWRFLVGLTVHLSGDDARRLERLTAACMQYAKRVVATLFAPVEYAGQRYHTVASIADTEGVMVWPSC